VVGEGKAGGEGEGGGEGTCICFLTWHKVWKGENDIKMLGWM